MLSGPMVSGVDIRQVREVLDRVTYQAGWQLRAYVLNDMPVIQVKGPFAPNWGRSWLIEKHHDTSDVVRTIYLAISTVESHERREFFRVDGKVLWNPHDPVI